jgi:hypothetical protein
MSLETLLAQLETHWRQRHASEVESIEVFVNEETAIYPQGSLIQIAFRLTPAFLPKLVLDADDKLVELPRYSEDGRQIVGVVVEPNCYTKHLYFGMETGVATMLDIFDRAVEATEATKAFDPKVRALPEWWTHTENATRSVKARDQAVRAKDLEAAHAHEAAKRNHLALRDAAIAPHLAAHDALHASVDNNDIPRAVPDSHWRVVFRRTAP